MVDGYTVPMFAAIGGLTVGEAYHITLAIADASDSALDSFVFLERKFFPTILYSRFIGGSRKRFGNLLAFQC